MKIKYSFLKLDIDLRNELALTYEKTREGERHNWQQPEEKEQLMP